MMNKSILLSQLKGTVSVVALCAVFGGATPLQARPLSQTQADINRAIDQNIQNSTVRTILKDGVAAGLGTNPSASSSSGTINGKSVTVSTSPTQFINVPAYKTISGQISGHNVTVATSAASFSRTSSRDTVTITVDGTTVYSGAVGNLKEADLLNAWNALGQTNANEITQRETARAGAMAVVNGISQRIAFILSPTTHKSGKSDGGKQDEKGNNTKQSQNGTMIGISSGDGARQYGVWSNFSYSFLENENSLSKYDGGLISGLMGGDYLVNNVGNSGVDLLTGIALSHEALSLTTQFNSGLLDTYGISIVPYAGLRFMEGKLVLDMLYAHTWLDSTTSNNRGFLEASANYNGKRDSWASNLTYNYSIEQFIISPGIGLVYAHEINDGYTNSLGSNIAKTNTYIGDVKAGARLTYGINNDLEVYTSHYYSYDIVPMFARNARTCTTPLGGCSNVRDQVMSSFGVNFYKDNVFDVGDMTLTGEVSHVFRESTPTTSLTLSARLTF